MCYIKLVFLFYVFFFLEAEQLLKTSTVFASPREFLEDKNNQTKNSEDKQQSKKLLGSNFAIINLKEVAAKSLAGKSIDEQISEINNKAKEDLIEFENNIKKIDSEVKSDTEERKVEDLQVILYDMARKKRYQIQNAYKVAVEALELEIRKIVKEISKEKKYSLIVISDVVVYNTEECPDITEETTKRLNERLSNIKVEIKELQS